MAKFTEFEAALLRLHWIHTRTYFLWQEIPKLKSVPGEYSFPSLVQEYAVTQLANFFPARRSILKHLAVLGKKDLDPAIRHIIEPLLEHEQTIVKLRDSYIAHIQTGLKNEEPFETQIYEILSKSKFPAAIGDIRMFVGRARVYIELIRFNFKQEMEGALKKTREGKESNPYFGILNVNECDELILDELDKAVNNLKGKNLAYPTYKRKNKK